MEVIVDTNVPKTANGEATPQASLVCQATCVRRIQDIQQEHILLLDTGWHILREYMQQLRSQGQPGVGDAFLKWVLSNQRNPEHCRWVQITHQEVDGQSPFAEFPTAATLKGFDLSDHKFVAVALARPAPVPILNATDSDWWHYKEALAEYRITVEFLCPDAMPSQT